MATITKQVLSGAPTGNHGNKLTDTSTSSNTDLGYLIHTAVSGTTNMDEIWLWASNTSASDVKVTVEFGGKDVDDQIVVKVAAESTELVVPGLILNNTSVVTAFAGTGNVITIFGYANRLDYS
jgi:hypothetical protein